MELPFAVESSTNHVSLPSNPAGSSVHLDDDAGSLVTASSQGSLIQSQHSSYEPRQQQQQQESNNPSISSSLAATGSRMASVFSSLTTAAASAAQQTPPAAEPVETIDFTSYVNVWETDEDEVDILLPSHHDDASDRRHEFSAASTTQGGGGDLLTLLLNRPNDDDDDENSNNNLVQLLEQAHQSSQKAAKSKLSGNLQQALDHHAASAKLFHQAALLTKTSHESMANSLLLLSQVQGKSAIALQRAVKLRPNSIFVLTPQKTHNNKDGHNDRLRAAVRGALDSRPEADMSESTFLGKATTGAGAPDSTNHGHTNPSSVETTAAAAAANEQHNPVDEMMALERELRDMDMALEYGNSIASLDARTQNRAKSMDGSFMVVPPGSSNSYMSSSTMWSAPNRNTPAPPPAAGTAGVRARANRVQNILEASASRPSHAPLPHNATATSNTNLGLESSWWGTSSAASQALTSSVISLASSTVQDGHHTHSSHQQQHHNPANNTKQLMRLMDSLKTLGDENAALLREVEQAEAARLQAKVAQDEMRRFREEYSKRFASLRAALKRFREENPTSATRHESAGNDANPVTNSEFLRTESKADQLQRQENLIKKLTADLKKEKEESKKKDAALRKYESFYREVKARSAQKAAQRRREARRSPPKR